jgi:multiple antibiotic resistance protein
MSFAAFASTFVTLIVIMDPVSTAPLFLSLTAGKSARDRRLAALQAVGAASALVVVFALFGQFVLGYLHVSLESLSIAGGLLLLLVALEMLRGIDPGVIATSNIALVPLATPLLAGPGAIAAVMVLARRYPDLGGRSGVVVGIAATMVIVALGLLLAGQIAKILRPAAVDFFTRVLGLLLAAIAVQLVVDGVRALVTSSGAVA